MSEDGKSVGAETALSGSAVATDTTSEPETKGNEGRERRQTQPLTPVGVVRSGVRSLPRHSISDSKMHGEGGSVHPSYVLPGEGPRGTKNPAPQRLRGAESTSNVSEEGEEEEEGGAVGCEEGGE